MTARSKLALVAFGVVSIAALLVFRADPLNPPHRANDKLSTGSVTPMIALGDNHGVILASDGSLWTWGETGYGWQVLGLGSNVRTQACLRRIGPDTDWIKVAAGGSTTLALKSDGTVWAWGENLYGQLGDGTMAQQQASPVRSVPGNQWRDIATAGPHSVALSTDGTLWAWGNNWAGQLGDGTSNYSRVPVRVGSSTNWTRIWANLIQNVAQQRDGSLWFWGWDYTRSQKGSSVSVPTRVSADTNWVSVGMGDWMVFAIKSDGTLWAWGRLAHHYTGATNSSADSWPTRVGTDTDWCACAPFAQSHPLFMKRDGSLWVLDGSDQRDPRGVALVTADVAGLVKNNQLNFIADGTSLGCDPAFGVVKTLQITFREGNTNRTEAFAENSPVSLGGTGQKLTVIQALYGDPRLVNNSSRDWSKAPKFLAPPLIRISLPPDVVAFCGGRHGLGVALTADGAVWTWGEALGRHTPGVPLLQFGAHLLNRVGLQVHWGDPGPVILKQPGRLEKIDPR